MSETAFPWRFPGRTQTQHPGAQHFRPDPVDLFAIVRFDGSAPLIGLLTARGIPVRVFDSLPAALTALRAVNTGVLVIRVALEERDEHPITFVIRNLGTLGACQDPFYDRFAEFFSGPVDAKTLYAAVLRHAGVSGGASNGYRAGQVA